MSTTCITVARRVLVVVGLRGRHLILVWAMWFVVGRVSLVSIPTSAAPFVLP